MLNQSYTLANPDIVFERFEDDLVVLSLRSGKYFGFNSAGALVWNALSEGISADRIADLGLDVKGLESFISHMLTNELLVTTAPGKIELSSELTSKLANNTELPTVEIYDDLADLIMADPIHNVDNEVGWPHLPAAK